MSRYQIKEELLNHCDNYVALRLDRIKQTIADIQESLKSETKSTAGDKHETGRAMLQLEREKAGIQLREIQKLQEVIAKININTSSKVIRLGSLVSTSESSYFIGISIGELIISNKSYVSIAANTPIGKLLLGKKLGDRFYFNGHEITINEVN